MRWKHFLGPVLLSVVLSWATEVRAEVPDYFNAIHCDPQAASELDWQSLSALVAAAGLRGLVLTIQFSPVWSPRLQSNLERAEDIENWVLAGHEIGGHHHVFGHSGGWDGYSNDPAHILAAGYLGDMQDWLTDLVAMLPESVEVLSVASKDEDFPLGVEFQTGGSGSTPSPSDALSEPTLKVLAGGEVWNLNHGALIAGGTWQIEEMKAAFNAASSGQVFGTAFHPHDYYPGNRTHVNEWFDFLASSDPDRSHSRTAGAILEAHRLSLTETVPIPILVLLPALFSLLLVCGGLHLRARPLGRSEKSG